MQTRNVTNGVPPRLSLDMKVELRRLTRLIGKEGHAGVWAINYEEQHGKLPSASQIVIGLFHDLGITVSAKSAERALSALRPTSRTVSEPARHLAA